MNGEEAFAILPCILFLGMIFFLVAIFVVWVLALIHAAMSKKLENQAVWLLVIILGGPIGAIAYFIARPFKQSTG